METLAIPARDGYPLAATLFEPPGDRRGWVQLNSATGVPRQLYRHFAAWLAEQGYAVVTYDYRGTGESFSGDIAQVSGHVRDWGEQDAAGVGDWLAGRAGSSPMLVLGHSIGGQLIGLCDNNRLYTRALCVAAQSGYYKLWPDDRAEVRRQLWESVPDLVREHGYFPGRRFGLADLPPGVALSWAKWCLSPDYVVDGDGAPLREHFVAFTAPMTFVRFTDDDVAPERAVEALMSFYANAPKRLEVIDPAAHGLGSIGHFDFFRPATARLWPLVARWLAADSAAAAERCTRP